LHVELRLTKIVRLRAPEFKIFNEYQLRERRSETFDEVDFVDNAGEVCIIPPIRSRWRAPVEYFRNSAQRFDDLPRPRPLTIVAASS